MNRENLNDRKKALLSLFHQAKKHLCHSTSSVAQLEALTNAQTNMIDQLKQQIKTE